MFGVQVREVGEPLLQLADVSCELVHIGCELLLALSGLEAGGA